MFYCKECQENTNGYSLPTMDTKGEEAVYCDFCGKQIGYIYQDIFEEI